MKSGNTQFGPAAQTPEQRAQVLARMKRTFPALVTHATPRIEQLYARYVAGELTWLQVRQESTHPVGPRG